MKTKTLPPRLATWSACSQLAELALVLDAIPAEFRIHLVQAALFPDRWLGNESYLVGEIRSLVFDCVTQLYGESVAQGCFDNRRESTQIAIPTSLRDGSDPAVIQLAVCDLLEELAASLTSHSQEQQDG